MISKTNHTDMSTKPRARNTESIATIKARLYDAQLTIQSMQFMAASILIQEMEHVDGVLHTYGKEAYIELRKSIEYIFGKDLYAKVREDAIDLLHIHQGRAHRDVEEGFEHCAFLLESDGEARE